MSRLEKFINNNRDEFDDMMPSEKSWQRVEASLLKKAGKRIVPALVLRWSAAAAVLIIIATASILMINKKNSGETAYVKKTDTMVTDLVAPPPDEAPQMSQFTKMIAGKQEELKLLAKGQPALYQKFTKDIIQLDSSYNTLKNKLGVTPNREMLMEAMIQNLELQLNVLNQQLNIIREIKQSKKYNHEKINPFI